MNTQSDSKRINITLPLTLLEELRAYIPKRQRNQFIVAALEREMSRLRLEKALQDSSGSWSETAYPQLATPPEVENYVREMRASYQPRSWDDLTQADTNE